ncbi:MAG: glycosyltransferase, partial [bacterium]
MPCFNEAKTIEKALDSIEKQTFQPDHVYVAEGGSTDGTPRILENWKDRLPLTILENHERRQSTGLNLCIEQSSSQYLARMDGHSYWNDRYLEI